jgi:hypothetical protein
VQEKQLLLFRKLEHDVFAKSAVWDLGLGVACCCCCCSGVVGALLEEDALLYFVTDYILIVSLNLKVSFSTP